MGKTAKGLMAWNSWKFTFLLSTWRGRQRLLACCHHGHYPPFPGRGLRGNLLNINYHPGGIALSPHFGSQRISTHRARRRGMCKWRKISCTIRVITCDSLAETLSAFSPTIPHFLKSPRRKDEFQFFSHRKLYKTS